MTAACKLHAWRDRELEFVATLLGAVDTGWRRAWGLAVPPVAVTCAPSAGTNEDAWQPLGPGARIRWSASAREELQSLLGAGFGHTALAVEAASACRQDAQTRLAAVLARPAGDAEQELPACSRWSGSVDAFLPCGSIVRMDAATVSHVVRGRFPRAETHRPRPPLTPLFEAAADRPTRVDARLAPCELDIATLQGLHVGDVIRLPHPLAMPLAVHGPGSGLLFSGFLARSGARRAIELASPAA